MRCLVRLSYEQWNHSNCDSLNIIKWSTIMQSYNYYRVIITDLNAPSYRSFVSHPMDLGTIEESKHEGLYVKTIIIRSHSGSNSDYDDEDEEEEEDDSPILRDPGRGRGYKNNSSAAYIHLSMTTPL